MNCSKFKLVFFFIIERRAVFIKKRHYRSLPSRTSKEAYNHVEKPILKIITVSLQIPRSFIIFYLNI
jgi:hypothetical protein